MRRIFTIGLMFLLPLAARAGELLILVDTGTEMPMARFHSWHLVDGIHRDVGLQLAHHMKRTPKFMSLPRKRIVKALEDGAADVCAAMCPNGSMARSSGANPSSR